jgi:hypothetical protein
MIKKTIFLLIVILTNFGAAHAEEANFGTFLKDLAKALKPTPTLSPTPAPPMVNVDVVDATVSLSKFDGSKWGGFGKVSPQTVGKVSSLLLGTNPYTAIISALSGPVSAGLEKPAPFGWVDVSINGQYLPNLRTCTFSPCQRPYKHTYTPIFNGSTYQNIPFSPDTRLRVTLYADHTLINPDPIGTAIINFVDLKKAVEAGKIYQVQVNDQTQNQLLFVGLDVRMVKK